jgi:hypothetical protein
MEVRNEGTEQEALHQVGSGAIVGALANNRTAIVVTASHVFADAQRNERRRQLRENKVPRVLWDDDQIPRFSAGFAARFRVCIVFPEQRIEAACHISMANLPDDPNSRDIAVLFVETPDSVPERSFSGLPIDIDPIPQSPLTILGAGFSSREQDAVFVSSDGRQVRASKRLPILREGFCLDRLLPYSTDSFSHTMPVDEGMSGGPIIRPAWREGQTAAVLAINTSEAPRPRAEDPAIGYALPITTFYGGGLVLPDRTRIDFQTATRTGIIRLAGLAAFGIEWRRAPNGAITPGGLF